MITEFQGLLKAKAVELYRDMPWREDTRPYYVLVSELMLQQTQVSRVIPKFQSFIAVFPDERALAEASLADVLKQWQGLGYNRRAKFLHESANKIIALGKFPDNETELVTLPGIGKNTAGAIAAYSFNKPSIFIETNIRTVYIHHFFADDIEVADSDIRQKLIETLDREHPREFYWALMDYGSWLKTNGAANNHQSSVYKRQAPLKGSIREVRGMILRVLSQEDFNYQTLRSSMPTDDRFEKALSSLISEKLVSVTDKIIHLTK